MAITGSDENKEITSDESPRRSSEVVNPITWPVFAQSVKVRIDGKEPTQTRTFGSAHKPTENDAGNRRKPRAQTAAPDEVNSPTVHGGESARTTAVVLSNRLWQGVQDKALALPLAPLCVTQVCSRLRRGT